MFNLFLFHLSVSCAVCGGASLRGRLWSLRLLHWCSILFDGDLFILNPLFLKVSGLETRDLMDIVAHSKDECYFIMLGLALLDLVSGYLSWQSW